MRRPLIVVRRWPALGCSRCLQRPPSREVATRRTRSCARRAPGKISFAPTGRPRRPGRVRVLRRVGRHSRASGTGQDGAASVCGVWRNLPALALGALVWYCDWDITDYASQFAALDAACRYDLGSNFAQTYTHPESSTPEHALTDCYRL